MDISILIGLIIGVVLLVKAIGLDMMFGLFYQPSALMIVLGGTIGAGFIHFPFSQVKKIWARICVVLSMKKNDFHNDIEILVNLSKKVAKEGKNSILPEISTTKDHFTKTALQLFVDNVDTDELKEVLEENLEHIVKRHHQGVTFFEQLGKYAPAFGLLGTVIGLIKLLSQLENPAALGPGMSLALVTTFYGILLSNLLFLPLAGRLKTYSYEEYLQKEMVLVGIMALAKGESSYIIREKMMLFLSKKDRVLKEKQGAKHEK